MSEMMFGNYMRDETDLASLGAGQHRREPWLKEPLETKDNVHI